jgi:hypothetical protein
VVDELPVEPMRRQATVSVPIGLDADLAIFNEDGFSRESNEILLIQVVRLLRKIEENTRPKATT